MGVGNTRSPVRLNKARPECVLALQELFRPEIDRAEHPRVQHPSN